ncbi:MAG TPA: Calx-beta domain-containing protein, partial [Thermoanaerobaculia bacterium]
STSMTFAVQLNVPTVATVTVNYATSNGTAIAGTDYANTSGTLTFAPGVTTQNISVPIIGDTLGDSNETFAVTLTSPSNATLGTASANGTILDDDVAPVVPSISIAPASLPEGNAGSTSMTFAVQLNVPTVATVSVNYATSDVTAIAGSDYAITSGTLTFAPGVSTQTISVPIIGDTLVESNESFAVTLTSPSNATLGTASANGTIVEDDVAAAVPSIAIASASVTEGNAGSTSMVFAVQLSVPTVNAVTVNYATSDVAATAGNDYANTNGTLTFAPGVTSQSIAVPVIGDVAVESNETFLVTLTSPSNATLGTANATGTIFDDDSLPFVASISIADVARNEGDSGATVFTFPVTLDAAASVPVSVAWSASAGSASATSDFVAASGTLVFAPGMTSQSISIAVHGDDKHEPDETFAVTLSAPSNGTLADANAIGTIRNDDDRDPAIPVLTASAVTIGESAGEAFVTLALSSRPASGASLRWMTRGGTASGTTDFVEASGRITFTATTATIPLSIVDDDAHEDAESFVVELFDATGVTLQDVRVQVTITDDDVAATPRAIVFVVGALHGDAGSRFGTAVQMVNASSESAGGTLVFHPAATSDSASDVTIPYTLAPRELRAWDDFLTEHGLSGLGTLDVIPTSGAIPHLTVRVYDDGSDGTTGFSLPIVAPSDALIAGDTGLLITPNNPTAARFNVGVRTFDEGVSLTIHVRNHLGTLVSTTARDYAPNYFQQLPVIAFTDTPLQPGDYLEIVVTHGSALLYGATVDNITNDPSVQVVMKK